MTSFVERYQNSWSMGRGTGSGRLSRRRASRRTFSEFNLSPISTMAAGVTTTAASAAKPTVAIPAYANDFRKYIGNRIIAAMDSATVVAENNTVRPAVVMVCTSASSRLAPPSSSSRKRLIISNV